MAQRVAKQGRSSDAAEETVETRPPSIGSIIRRLRREKGMSLQEVAKKSGVSVGMLVRSSAISPIRLCGC